MTISPIRRRVLSTARVGVGCLILMVGGARPGFAQQDSLDQQVTKALTKFEDPDWSHRAAAFYQWLDSLVSGGLQGRTQLVRPALADTFAKLPTREDEIRMAFIGLLERENARARPAVTPRLTEDFTNYWGDLVAAVAGLRDKRSVRSLVTVIGSGDLATNGLAALGRDALDAVLERANEGDLVRQAVTRTLSQMLDPAMAASLDAATVLRVKTALIHAAKDQNFWVRVSAIPGLARLPGDDVTGVLRVMAEHDPYARPGQNGQPAVYYLVRERARAALLSRGGRCP